ncbi:MAG: hypothetical protein CM1200mP10_12140 [Candidatus Neomarinimicrobiota bacterium]|nr:MAG: hypothetical protein CM1200mP10_12140 [Candidatus Neomarinimicrobiota bacterium]
MKWPKAKGPILTGVAEYTTQGACETVVAAKEVGVDGIMLLPALVYKSDEREIMAHYPTVATSTDLPIMCYNNPPVYGVGHEPRKFQRVGGCSQKSSASRKLRAMCGSSQI